MPDLFPFRSRRVPEMVSGYSPSVPADSRFVPSLFPFCSLTTETAAFKRDEGEGTSWSSPPKSPSTPENQRVVEHKAPHTLRVVFGVNPLVCLGFRQTTPKEFSADLYSISRLAERPC